MAIYRWRDNRVRAVQVPASYTRAQAEAFMDEERGFREAQFGLTEQGLTMNDELLRPGDWIVIFQDRIARIYTNEDFVRLFV